MKKLILPILALLALGGGAGAGLVLRPAGETSEEAIAEAPPEQTVVNFRDGFVVPILRDGRSWTHVVLTLGVEAHHTTEDRILLQEPVLRDALTEALFRHGSMGGFDGNFTDPLAMNGLRMRLNEVISAKLEDETARVLIVSMARQTD